MLVLSELCCHSEQSCDCHKQLTHQEPLQTYNITFLTTWIKDHVAAAAALGKPLIVEEFGKQARHSLRCTRSDLPQQV